MELVLLILGALAGVAADRGYDQISPRVLEARRRARLKKRDDAVNPITVSSWLKEYYQSEDLYNCTVSGQTHAIPTYVHEDWLFFETLDQASERFTIGRSQSHFETDQGLISRRENEGQRLFNNATMYLQSFGTKDGLSSFEIAETEYFHVISNLIRLEDEVFDSLLRSKRVTPFRDANFRNQSDALAVKTRPLSFGISTAFVVGAGSEKRLVLHERSKQTVTHGSAKAVFPCFGLSPIGDLNSLSMAELLYYNIVKEYLEEFFDYEELIDSLSKNRLDPLWFLRLPEAVDLEAARQSGALQAHSLGLSLDWLSGTSSLSVLVELSDEDLAEDIERKIVGNWEVEMPTLSGGTIEFVDVFSPSLGELLMSNNLHGGSAFTIERVQKFYENQRKQRGV